jgi:membrane AbrB-like protein
LLTEKETMGASGDKPGADRTARLRLAGLRPAAQWGLLIAVSALLAALFALSRLPAALLLGPMVGGILIAVNGGHIRVPRLPYIGSQAIIGCLIARAITGEIVLAFLARWPLFLAITLAVIGASGLLGFILSRRGVLPGTTAIWGSSPGAANAMMLMAEAYGADFRLVALMQYVRVAFVALTASLVARVFLHGMPATPMTPWFGPVALVPFVETLALAGIGAGLGRILRIPAGSMLLPMVASAVLHVTGLLTIELPQWLLAFCYALLGWNIGLGFTRKILGHASRALPQIALSTMILIAFCGGLAFILTRVLGIDPLTAYLATSPGGMDSVAIIAASSHVDLSFVMALQLVRFLIVLGIGPRLARFVAERTAEA